MLYAIDVDGVIIKSYEQVIIDGYNTYNYFFKNDIFGVKRITLKNCRKVLLNNKAKVKKLISLLRYAKTGGESVYIFSLLSKKVKNEYDFKKGIKKKEMEIFQKEFYQQRYIFQKQRGWQKIITPYKEMVNFINTHSDETIILSNKDAKTIKLLLKYYGIRYRALYDNSLTNDKNIKLKMIKNKFRIAFEDIIFIDDNLRNLKDAVKLKVRCFMASWGLNTKSQQQEALKQKIAILRLKDLTC